MHEPEHWRDWRDSGFSVAGAAQCAANFAINYQKKLNIIEQREVSSESCSERYEGQASTGISPVGSAMRSEIRAELEAVIDDLNEAQQGVVRLRFFEDLTLPEIALAVGVTADAARMTIVRALIQLRKQLLTLVAICIA